MAKQITRSCDSVTLSNDRVKTRIAPSPTGALHIGTARTALFNYLFAKQHKSQFILRIEDTDKTRSEKKYEKDIKDGLRWLGLEWDQEYKQSNRGEVYKKYIKKLPAYEKDGVIYLKVKNQKIKFKDIIRGDIEIELEKDFIVARSETEPLYNLACVIDDSEMQISHVIRGEDHISNTPKQILIYNALNLQIPQFAHLPLILGADRSKLSKRHGATSLSDYKKDYLPEALINYMALLGWNPGTTKEIFTKQELIKNFSLKRVQKGGAIFDVQRLDWMNSKYIRNMSSEKLSKLLDLEQGIIDLEKQRVKKLTEFKEFTKFISKLPEYKKELLFFKNMTREQVANSLKKAIQGESLEGRELWPPRAALSGQKGSPSYFEIAKVLGKTETLKRLKIAQAKLFSEE